MYASKIELDEEQIKKYKTNSNKIFFETKLNFLKCHRGIRPNKMHLLIAPTHAGKSTLVRSLLCDYVFRNKDAKVLLILSEETRQDFLTEFSNTVPVHDVLSNIRVLSEQDWSDTPIEEFEKNINEHINYFGIDLVLFDNITTSKLYNDRSVKEQSAVSTWLKNLTKRTTMFLVAHSLGSDFNNRLLDENDIRGSKTITNLTEFLYILQPVYVGDKIYQFINIKKHRGQEVINKFYQLRYDKHLKAFDTDKAVNFEAIAEIFKQRNQLGKK
jgi:GTPase SAR1 family protein